MPKLTPRYGVIAMTRNRAMTAEGKTVPMLAMRATASVITLTVWMATAKAAAPQAVAPGRSSKLFRLGRDRRERNKSNTRAIVQATSNGYPRADQRAASSRYGPTGSARSDASISVEFCNMSCIPRAAPRPTAVAATRTIASSRLNGRRGAVDIVMPFPGFLMSQGGRPDRLSRRRFLIHGETRTV